MGKIKLIALIFFFFLIKFLIAQTTIQFAGINWNIRSGTGGPGPNNWSNSSNSVWVDANGYLHLKIRKAGSSWYCAEIYAQQSFGYGGYRFYVASNVENYDPNIVVGLFTYENDNREIDIEFSRWGNSSNVDGWFTVHPPPYNSSNQESFPLNLSSDYSTHKFIWNSSNIFFQSYHGYSESLPSSDSLINQWTYTGNNNPPAGNERLHINFWLYSGNPPINQQEAELIINAVYVPSGSLQVALLPGEAVGAGAQWNVDDGIWQNSGTTVNNLAIGLHTVNFKSITGWAAPLSINVTIYENQISYGSYFYSPTVGIVNIQNRDFKIYPVPANDNLTIESAQNDIINSITILDALGQIIYSGIINKSELRLNVSDYKDGIYIIHIHLSNKNYVARFCIIK